MRLATTFVLLACATGSVVSIAGAKGSAVQGRGEVLERCRVVPVQDSAKR